MNVVTKQGEPFLDWGPFPSLQNWNNPLFDLSTIPSILLCCNTA